MFTRIPAMRQMKKNSDRKIREDGGKLFLGLDLSTQALKALLIDNKSRVHYETAINYDRDLPEFKTNGGVHRRSDGLTVTSPAIMWVAALDLLLEKMKADKVSLAKVAAISGSGQQHGSVYFRHGAGGILAGLDSKKDLRSQLRRAFSITESPVWMDSSTSRECRARDLALGGAQATAESTGSRSYERFTGNQIAKIAKKYPRQYAETEQITLVSSFLASLLIGGFAPIDTADGAGMNLMNIVTKKWHNKALACTAAGLAAKLPPLVAAHKPVGTIHDYFVRRYGFAAETLVIAFSGDNPNSLAAFGLDRPGSIAISLGTSDTIFGALTHPKPSAVEGHIFANPIDPKGYMALLCWKNGSLTREFVRDAHARGSWDRFNRLLAQTPPGNNGLIGFYFKEPEITPPVLKPGIHLFNSLKLAGRTGCAALPFEIPTQNIAPAQHVRAVLESQFLSMRLHCENIGLKPRMIIATGGASVNLLILKIMADVFGQSILTIERPNSAALGAAMRALHGWKCLHAGKFIPFNRVISAVDRPKRKASPNGKNHRIYTAALARYRRLEELVAGRSE